MYMPIEANILRFLHHEASSGIFETIVVFDEVPDVGVGKIFCKTLYFISSNFGRVLTELCWRRLLPISD